MGVDLERGGVVWLRRFLGRGRNGMWLGRLALFGSAYLAYVEPKLFFFFAQENSGVQLLVISQGANLIIVWWLRL